LGLQTFVIHPNSDAGSQQVVEVVRSYICHSHIHVFDTLEDRTFVNLLRGAAVLVGNSSLGLLEAPFLKLPVINVGRRQTARLHAENVFFVPHDRKAIGAQVRLILDDESVRSRVRNCSNPFGDGLTGPRVAELLAMVPIDCKLLNKDLTY
jgi:GDP/UDP-N,N'-diacetylbacillosamine 2-epimerase (hydrolysing)